MAPVKGSSRRRARVAAAVLAGLGVLPTPFRRRFVLALIRVVPGPVLRVLVGASPRLLAPTDVVPIAGGLMAGTRWILGSSLPSCVLGAFSVTTQHALAEYVRPGDTVIDAGANVGYLSLLGARLVGPAGVVVAIEPFPDAFSLLQRHIRLNAAANVVPLQVGLSDRAGKARFREGPHNSTGVIAEDGTIEIETVTLDALVEAGAWAPPSVLKIDVEGAEERVLRGAGETLRRHRPVIILATHGRGPHDACLALLGEACYTVRVLRFSGDAAAQRAEVVCLPVE